MSSEEKRKATDIILDLEQKVDNLTRYLTNVDLNIKLILNRLDGLKTADLSNVEARPSQDPKPTPVPVEKQVTVESFAQVPGSSEKKIIKSVVAPKQKKNTIYQRVFYPDSGKAILVNVNIFDEQGSPAGQTKTDMSGKWKILLRPGKYTVVLKKSGTQNKPPIDETYPITIEENTGELDNFNTT